MKFEVEVYLATDAGNSGCEIVDVECKNRAEAGLRAEQARKCLVLRYSAAKRW